MNVEQLITRYVYQHGEVALQGLGTIKLTEALPDMDYLSKHSGTPLNGIDYQWQPNITTTPSFVKFYAEQRGKIASLADSDIQAFWQMAVQLLNIGNPFEIKGLGTLQKQNDGRLNFVPGNYISFKEGEDSSAPNRFRERAATEEPRTMRRHTDEPETRSSRNVLKLAGALLATVVLVGAGWWVYTNFIKQSNTSTALQDSAIPADTVAAPAADTTLRPDSAAMVLPPVVDSNAVQPWKAYFRTETGKEAALKAQERYNRTRSLVQMETADSMTFQYYVLVNGSLRDTARLTDSLKRLFARPVNLVKP